MKRSRILVWTVLALLLAAAAAQAQETRRAKRYIIEVRTHLPESYVGRDDLSRDELNTVALKALRSAVGAKEFAHLDEDVRAAIDGAVEEADTVYKAVDAAAEAAGDADFDLLRVADHATRAMVASTGDPFP
ncbi:MAG: hypothetical protein ACYTAF_13235 [Planctomycetota bacterium]|jgi:hypothetical protein